MSFPGKQRQRVILGMAEEAKKKECRHFLTVYCKVIIMISDLEIRNPRLREESGLP